MNLLSLIVATALFAVPAMAEEAAEGMPVDNNVGELAKEWSGVSLAQGHFQKQLESFIRAYQSQQVQLTQLHGVEAKLKWTLDNWVPKSAQPGQPDTPAPR